MKLSDEKIRDYIDGRLSERDRAVVAAYLFANPDVGAKVARLRLIDEMIAGLGQDILNEPIPDRLVEVLFGDHGKVEFGR